MPSIDSITPTICSLMGLEPPAISRAEPIMAVLKAAEEVLGEEPVEKMLVYAPDAIGEGLFRDYRRLFGPVIGEAPIQVGMRSMSPSVTPVCFASMFTGAPPEAHRIMKYEKPVLRCDTIFDALIRAGRKVAIVAVKDSSIDLIFRGRAIDHHTEPYDPEVTRRVLRLLEEDNHDLILAYHQEYDDAMHASTPRSPEALEAFKRHLGSFITLADAFNYRHEDSNRAVAFLPDHGTHVDPETGRGSHGTDSPEDMEVRHFWGIGRGKRRSPGNGPGEGLLQI